MTSGEQDPAAADRRSSNAETEPRILRHARLSEVIDDIVSDNGGEGPEKERLDGIIRQKLWKMHDRPNISALEFILHKRVTEDEARHILFFPDEDQAALYRVLIANAPKGAPSDHPQRLLQTPHMTLLYLHHWKRWDFVSSFIVAGGLRTLSSLFIHENPVVRMNAVNTFANMTAHKGFDWWKPPPGLCAGATIEDRLHRALLNLRSDPCFIPGLIANSYGSSGRKLGEHYPGCCLISLEVLAMWLSWVRLLHTVGRKLRLSRYLLDALKTWGGEDCARVHEDPAARRATLPSSSPTSAPRPSSPLRHTDSAELACSGQVHRVPEAINGSISSSAPSLQTASAEYAPEQEVSSPCRTSACAEDKCTLTARDDAARAEEEVEFAPVPWPRNNSREAVAAGQEETAHHRAAVIVDAAREEDERAKVVALADRLVADFGRLPPADEGWGDSVNHDARDREITNKSTSDSTSRPPLPRGDSSLPAVGTERAAQQSDEHPLPPRSDREASSSVQAQQAAAPDPWPTRVEAVEALKDAGNDDFRAGRFTEAYGAYSAALDAVHSITRTIDDSDAAGPTLGAMTSPLERHSVSGQARRLRGVLCRNRAAAALRLIDLERVGTERDATEPSPNVVTVASRDGTCAPDDPGIDSAPSCIGRTCEEVGAPARRVRQGPVDVPSGLALLQQCERDCVVSIDVDPEDKKAVFRLARCREIRRSFSRPAGDRVFDHDDERQRKCSGDRTRALLAAKILARAGGSHEMLGGSGGGCTDAEARAIQSNPIARSPAARVPAEQSLDSEASGHINDEHDDAASPKASTEDPAEDGALTHGRRTSRRACGSKPCDHTTCGPAGIPLADEGSRGCFAPREGADLSAGTLGEDAGGGVSSGENDKVASSGRAQHGPAEVQESRLARPVRGDSSGAASHARGSAGLGAKKVTTKGHASSRGAHRRCPTRTKKGSRVHEASICSTASETATSISDAEAEATTSPRASHLDAVRIRKLRRQLALLSAPRKTAPVQAAGAEACEQKIEDKLAFHILASLPRAPGSLQKLFGDGITVESLSSVVRGLRYAFGMRGVSAAADQSPNELEREARFGRTRACQVFVELSRVKRVGLAVAMSTREDKTALLDTLKSVHHECDSSFTHGDSGNEAEDTDGTVGANGRKIAMRSLPTRAEIDAAVRAYGL